MNTYKDTDIDDYVTNRMESSKRQAFEQVLQQDWELNKEVKLRLKLAKTLNWQKEILDIHEEMLNEEEVEPAPSSIPKSPSKLRIIRRVLSYAAILIPGILIGWYANNITNPQTTVNGFGSSGENAVTLYDAGSHILRMNQNTENQLVTNDSKIIQLIITKQSNPTTSYTLTDEYLEIFLDNNLLKVTNLAEGDASIVLQDFTTVNTKIALLKINENFYPLSLSKQDFSKLFE